MSEYKYINDAEREWTEKYLLPHDIRRERR